MSEREGSQRERGAMRAGRPALAPDDLSEERAQSGDLARVALERHGGAVLARLYGEIDLSNAAAVEDQVTAGLADATAVAVDLSGLSYLDSAGLALLSRLAGRLSGLDGWLRLVVPPDAMVGRTLSISGLASAIPVDETVEAALAALARG